MAKVFIEETTLTAIGDAIRGKEGSTELVPVNDMATRISSIQGGGGGADIEPIVLEGICTYACAGNLSGYLINSFPNKITTKAITNASYLFHYNKIIKSIPFDINIKEGSTYANNMFTYCAKLEHIPDLDFKHTSYVDYTEMFMDCKALKSLPKIYNAYPGAMARIFSGCTNLRYIPDDFFDTWNFNRPMTSSTNTCNIFAGCYSLRKIPSSLFERYYDWATTTGTYSTYKEFVYNCATLDEVVDLPVATKSLTSNTFQNTINNCYRLKRFTFKMNDDGTPKTAKWKSQLLLVPENVGCCAQTTKHTITDYNSGITADKEVTDDATYQALKNDPDWFTTNIAYSRYNHDSAVETINSLPDTSATGTNTIKFKGAAGSLTDGGAIENLTAEEIAVATAKGWTVTLV